MKEGVDVKLIVYGTYSLGNIPFYQRMRHYGVPVKKYSGVTDVLLKNPFRFWLRHLHDKYLVVDGEEAISGGMNWSGRYERGGTDSKVAWRDTDLLVRGPQANIVEMEFQKRWNREDNPKAFTAAQTQLEKAYKPLLYPAEENYTDYLRPDPSVPCGYRVRNLTRFLYQQPFEDSGHTYMTNFYKEIIDRAQSHIFWQSISIRPSDVQKKALLDAAARGVDVRLMTNSRRNMSMIPIGGLAVYCLARSEYRELLEGGIRIFEYSGKAPMHAKGFMVDDVVAVIGSYNATFTAEKYYTESALAVYDTNAIRDVHQMFDEDFASCKEVTLDSLKSIKERPPHKVTAGIVQTSCDE